MEVNPPLKIWKSLYFNYDSFKTLRAHKSECTMLFRFEPIKTTNPIKYLIDEYLRKNEQSFFALEKFHIPNIFKNLISKITS